MQVAFFYGVYYCYFMKKIFLLLVVPLLIVAKPKALHLTFHRGTEGEVKFLCKHLGIELDSWYLLAQKGGFLDGKSRAAYNYVMTHDRAQRIFNKHYEKFKEYDLIITSDIAPLSRIFLQNNWKKPLLVWVCNRFDMNPLRTGNQFPDKEYLELFQNAKDLNNVEIIGYTKYEKFHAEEHKNVTSISETITPTGLNDFNPGYNAVPKKIFKPTTFFIRNYINERRINLGGILNSLGIDYYTGSFAGSNDLKDFMGMIHIPVVMGNLQLWENLSQGIVHFIPSPKFYKKLYSSGRIQFWDWTNPSTTTTYIPAQEIFDYCDWYDESIKELMVYFDSFEELPRLIRETNFKKKREAIKEWHKGHAERCLDAWKPIFNRLLSLDK